MGRDLRHRNPVAPPLSPITRYEHHQQHGFLSLKHAARLIRGRNSWLGTEYGGSDFSAFFIDGKLIASFFLPATEIPVPIPAYFWREVDAATVARSRDSSGRLQPPYKAPVTDAIDRYIKELNLVADSRDMTDLEAIDPWLSSRLALHASYNPTDLADLKASVHSLIQTLQEHRQGPPQLVGVLFEDWERFLRTHVEFPVTLKSRGARPIKTQRKRRPSARIHTEMMQFLAEHREQDFLILQRIRSLSTGRLKVHYSVAGDRG